MQCYYSLYIRTQSSTRKDSNFPAHTFPRAPAEHLSSFPRAHSLYPADSTPCPADTLLPKRVADLISLPFTELIHSIFASLQLNGSDTIFHYSQQGCMDSSQIFPQLLPSSPRNPISSKSMTTFPRRRCLSNIAIQTMAWDLQM